MHFYLFFIFVISVDQLIVRLVRCTLCMHNFLAKPSFSTIMFVLLPCVCTKLASNRPIYTPYNVEKYPEYCQRHHTIVRYEWFRTPSLVMNSFVYHHYSYMILYIIVCMVLYAINHFAWFRIPQYIHGFVYHHSLYMVSYTIVYIVYHRSLYMVSYTIVGYKNVSFSLCM